MFRPIVAVFINLLVDRQRH